jgi:hypothetical protein
MAELLEGQVNLIINPNWRSLMLLTPLMKKQTTPLCSSTKN